jgi:hypothetical protein
MDDEAVNANISPVNTRTYCRARETDLKGPTGRAERRGALPARPVGGLKINSVRSWRT